MQIVIDIPDEDYKTICGHIKKIESKNGEGIKSWYNLPMRFESAIYHGIPLPKGHGDLIDKREVIKSLFDYHKGKKTIGQCIEDVQTIIKVDATEIESEGKE